MREMKDSGYEWIGNVCADVKLIPLKYMLRQERTPIKVGPFGSQLSGNDFVNEETDYWVYNQRTVIDENYEEGNAFISRDKYDSMEGFHVYAGDILLTTRGTIGKISRVPLNHKKGILHPCIIRFRIDDSKYDYELLRLIFNYSDFVSRQINYKSNATTIEVIYSDTLRNIMLPVWKMEEQIKIRKYLDHKCVEIDILTADIETQIEILEQYKRSIITETVTKGLNPDAGMKNSGVRWIGQMPAHWKTTRLKYCSAFSPKPLNRPKNENSVIEYLPMEFIKNGYYINNTEQMSNLPNSLTPFDEGDIVFAKVTPCFENGNIAIMNNLHNGYGVGSSELFVIRATSIYREFLFYWLQNSAFKAKAISTMTGMGGLKRVSGSFVQNSEIVFPPLSEQQAIAAYLDRKCAEIDSLIADKRTQLDTLAEYKKSLIYEYVTGKKEVPV